MSVEFRTIEAARCAILLVLWLCASAAIAMNPALLKPYSGPEKESLPTSVSDNRYMRVITANGWMPNQNKNRLEASIDIPAGTLIKAWSTDALPAGCSITTMPPLSPKR